MGSRESKRSSRAGSLRRAFYGSVLVVLGFGVGLIAGSILETPRLLADWLQGPVRSVDLRERASPVAATPEPPARPPRLPAVRPEPKPAREKAPPAAVEPAPPSAKPGTLARSADAVIEDLARELAARSGAAPERLIVQVASTTDQGEADRIAGRLTRAGFDAFTVMLQPPDGPRRFRVRVRPSGGVQTEDLASRLRQRGYATWITHDR
jgi:cell division protein FtsN